ncbi:MAG: hypothetical protein R2824_04010 [Saprospiraceae bacterium]
MKKKPFLMTTGSNEREGTRIPWSFAAGQLLLLIFLVTISFGTLSAQTNRPDNMMAFHLDKAFYVNGEVIWYQLYLPAGFREHDIMLKLSLRDNSGKPVEENFLDTRGGTTVNGYFKLPYDIAPNVYHFLVMATESASKKRVKLGEVAVPVYNDLDDSWKDKPSVSVPSTENVALKGLQLDIQLADSGIKKRGEVSAGIKVTDASGRPVAAELSVSVRDENLAHTAGTIKNITIPVEIDPATLDNDIYINGRLLGPDGQARTGITIGAFASDDRTSYYADTDQEGRFALHLQQFTGDKPLQFVDLQGASFRIELDDQISLDAYPAVQYTEDVKNYLEWSRSRKMIYQLYQTVEAGLQIESPVTETPEMEPDMHIRLKDYASFADLYTFLLEVSTPLKLRKDEEGGLYARMFNPDPRVRVFYQQSPIFIVDGKITRNVNFLQQLDIEKLEVIDEFFDFQRLINYFGKIGSNGVVIVQTSIPNLQLPESEEAGIFSIRGLLPKGKVIQVEDPAPHRPVFKPQLYWSAGEETNAQGQFRLQFPHTDDLGTFIIEVVAKDKDGRMGTVTTSYRVNW